MTEDVKFDVQDEIGLLTFNRPESRNSLTFAMYEELFHISEEIASKVKSGDRSIKALIVTGSGEKAFAAGTDMSEFRNFSTDEEALGYERTMDRVLGTYERVPIPTIAAIRGACTGGGGAIAAASDLRYADSRLKFGFPMARTLGNCLSITNLSRLVSLLGQAKTREILFTARLIEAEEALSIGLITELVEDPLQRALDMAEVLKTHSPLLMEASKEGLRRIREKMADINDDDLIVKCYNSRDFHEGIDAFLSKRKPQWQGN